MISPARPLSKPDIAFQSNQVIQTFEILAQITAERPHVPLSHTQAHALNAPLLERSFSRAYLGPSDAPQMKELRTTIANGARQALESQSVPIIRAAHPGLTAEFAVIDTGSLSSVRSSRIRSMRYSEVTQAQQTKCAHSSRSGSTKLAAGNQGSRFDTLS